jgi:GDP-L-fucose synthase
LIRKAEENLYLEVWGDGTQIRDFVYAEDVARGMLFAVENKISIPLNLGSGSGVAISEIAEIVANRFDKKIKYLTDAPSGDPIRILDMSRAKSYGFELKYSLLDGINKAIDWYLENKNIINKRYNVFH